jgi:8-oxo-dGTP pyrophosphatase MutT (NUDIX family)
MSPDEIAAALAAWPLREIPALPGRRNDRPAGVLVPIVWAPEPEVLLIARAPHLREHAGEIAFPGGKPDAADQDIAATALREAAEELGITGPRLLGRLSAMPLFTSDHRLFPLVAALPDAAVQPDPGEVAAVLRVPLRRLLHGPPVDAIPFPWDGVVHPSPVFPIGERLCYGATAHVLWELAEALCAARGHAPPPLVSGRYTWGVRGGVSRVGG